MKKKLCFFSTAPSFFFLAFFLRMFSVKKLETAATIPTKGSKDAAGFDLYCYKAETVPAVRKGCPGKAVIPIGIAIATPPGTYARIAARSGNSLKHSIEVGAGVVDHDYRGPLNVILYNFSDEDYIFKAGERVAQMILEWYDHDAMVQEVDALPNTDRGAKGFGSTGN
jgi:deoxyuridine 5'-triphosphate nucleotidohydrolase